MRKVCSICGESVRIKEQDKFTPVMHRVCHDVTESIRKHERLYVENVYRSQGYPPLAELEKKNLLAVAAFEYERELGEES